MLNHLTNTTNATDVRLLLPETLWLELEHYQRAKEISQTNSLLTHENQRWQAYLNALALLAFKDWLTEKLPDHEIQASPNEAARVSHLKVDQFKLCLITVEHVLDEIVSIPKAAIEQPDLAAHFYVVLEVLEDQEEVVVRGFLRHDELVVPDNGVGSSQADEICQFPLAAFDAELNHLVVCIRYSEPNQIPLPTAFANSAGAFPSQQTISMVGARLSQWLQGALDEGWRAIDELVNPDLNLAWAARHTTSSGVKGGKLINFGVQLGNQSVVLLITVTPDSDGKIGINAQVLPIGDQRVLPSQLKLTLLSNTDKTLQEVQSRERDNYIQLKPFKGRPGARFSIEVNLHEIRVRETFEL